MITCDVAIVGGGCIGLGIAWRAARAGLGVVLIDPGPGRGATWAAAGMLGPVAEVNPGEEQLLELNLASAALYPAFVAELEAESGRAVGYLTTGTLEVARDVDENVALDDLFRLQEKFGLEVERLDRRSCRTLEPALSPSVRGGILVAGDHQVDNRALVDALVTACDRAGVRFERRRALGVTADAHATRVRCPGGWEVSCGSVIVAAGCWSDDLDLPGPARPPLRPVKGQLLQLRSLDGPLPARRVIRGESVYLVPRSDGRMVVGATVEERGLDARVTAEAVFTLLRDAFEIVPGVLDMELIETVVGFRPASPDNSPLLGPSSVPGLLFATGHFRNGVLLTPVTAHALVDTLVDGRPPDTIAPFLPGRFAREERSWR